MHKDYVALFVAVIAAVACVSCNRSSESAANNQPPAATSPTPAQPNQPPPNVPGQPPAAAGDTSHTANNAAPQAENPHPAQQPAPVATPAGPPPAPEPRRFTVREGSALRVRTTSTITTKTAQSGAPFTGSLEAPLMAGDTVIAPRGALVNGRVVESDPGGRVSGVARLTVQLTSVQIDGKPVRISTATVTSEAKSTKKKDAAKVGIGAGVGAAIGAIAGGGRGAAIGAGVGAGAGTATVMATHGDPAVIPAESVLTFALSEPVTVTR